jgi:hypothetical protein
MSLLCSTIDKFTDKYKYWTLNSDYGPFTENNITFYVKKGSIIKVKDDNNQFYGVDKGWFQIIHYSKIIKAMINYEVNGKYILYIMVQKKKLPNIHEFILKVDLNYCSPYEIDNNEEIMNSIDIELLK